MPRGKNCRETIFVAPANLQKCVGGFLSYKFWRIFPGIFLEDFSGHFFPQKRGEKIRRRNPRKNPAAQNQKSAKNPFCQNLTLIFAAQLPRDYPHRGADSERVKKPSLVGERQFGRHLRDTLGEGSCESKTAAETVGSQLLPRGIKMSRRTLWDSLAARQFISPTQVP